MYPIEKKVLEILENKSLSFDKKSLARFEATDKEFRKFVASGIVKPRGYSLQTIEAICKPQIVFNMKTL